jgi:Family of unknown function (DUF6527)
MRIEKQLRLRAAVSSRTEAANHLKLPGDAVLVNRGLPRLLLLMCPCGCGEPLPINLDGRAGPAWRLYRDRNDALTLYPSVWRESGCESHFIIWRNQILLFGQSEDDFDDSLLADEGMPTSEAVLAQIPHTGVISFFEIAEALGAVPWDVLRVCRRLVRLGGAREGRGKERGSFGRKLRE